jgi:hypothetical protein
MASKRNGKKSGGNVLPIKKMETWESGFLSTDKMLLKETMPKKEFVPGTNA